MNITSMTSAEFGRVRDLVYDLSGISLSDSKRTLVLGRLGKRIAHYGCRSMDEYLDIVAAPGYQEELQLFVNLLTTNETSFFREPKHFDFLRTQVVPALAHAPQMRVWSAACSTGEEPYTIAMVLAGSRGNSNWEVLATDLSTRVLKHARTGHYPEERSQQIPVDYLHRYCLKGIGPQSGTFLIDRNIRARVNFQHMNLVEPLPDVGVFDVIFLRNVLIYFDPPTKAKVVGKLLATLKPGGYFLPGHCESLQGVSAQLEPVRPAIYRKSA